MQYDTLFEEFPYHIRIYQNDINTPLFTIESGERNTMTLNHPGNEKDSILSFEFQKDDYQRLGLQGILNYDRVRLRTAPTLESYKIGSLMKGDVVEILNRSVERMTINDMNSYWFKVKTPEGIAGWTYGYFMDLGNVIYADSGDEIIIFQKWLALDQGLNQRLLFYKNKEQVNDSGWFGGDKFLIFAAEKRIVLTKFNESESSPGPTNEFSERPGTHIFNMSGTLIDQFDNTSRTIKFERVVNSPLFYIIESYGLDSQEKWANKCLIYDLDGNIINQKIYNEIISDFSFNYKEAQYHIRLVKP